MAWTFCTKDQVVATRYFDPALLQDDWSEAVEAMIKRHLRSPHLGTTKVITNELSDGSDTPILVVQKPPIYSVQALRVSDSLYTATDYKILSNYVVLTSGGYFPNGTLNVSIDYTSGGDVDPIINITAVAMIAAFINFRERYGSDVSLTWGVMGTDEKIEKGPNLNVGLTSHLSQIMKRMLERNKIRVA